MPSNIGPALGIVAQTFGDRLAEKHKEQYEQEQKQFALISGMVKAGVESGRVDPNEAMTWFVNNGPGKRGKGNKSGGKEDGRLAPLKNLIGGIMKAGGQQQGPSQLPHFLSNEQMAKQQEDATINLKKREMTEITDPEKEKEHQRRMQEIEARIGPVDKQTQTRAQQLWATGGQQGNWEDFIPQAAQALAFERAKKENQPKTAAEKRGDELAQQRGLGEWSTLSDSQRRVLTQVGATQLDSERRTKMDQATERLSAALALSNVRLKSDVERYSELKELFPYTVALKELGVEIAGDRKAIDDYKVANPAGARGTDPDAKVTAAQQKAAAALVQKAEKDARAAWGKQGFLARDFGIGTEQGASSEEDLANKLLKEYSGGVDPDVTRSQARANIAGPKPSEKPPASTRKVGEVVITKDGTKHKITRVLPMGRYELDPTPVP